MLGVLEPGGVDAALNQSCARKRDFPSAWRSPYDSTCQLIDPRPKFILMALPEEGASR